MNSTEVRSLLRYLGWLPQIEGHSFVTETDLHSSDIITEFSREEDVDYSSFGTLINISATDELNK